MSNPPFPLIKTDRLILRRLNNSDWETISYLRSNKIVNTYVDRPTAETKEEAIEFITKIDHAIEKQSSYYWAITKKEQNIMIGSICLWNISADRKIAEVGYDLDPKHHKKGIMNESLLSIIQFGMEVLKLNSIEAYTHKDNVDSTNLLERNGFQLIEGRKDENNADNRIYAYRRK